MRFLITGDLHGRIPVLPDVPCDAIIAPGDFCGDTGIREAYLRFYQEHVQDPASARPWWSFLGKRKAKSLLLQNVREGHAVLRSLDRRGVPVFVIPGNWDYPGEPESSWPFLHEDFYHERVLTGLRHVVDFDRSIVEFDGVSLIGYGWVNGPELLAHRVTASSASPEDLAESEEEFAELRELYDTMFSHADNPVVLVGHNVPFGTLDVVQDPGSPAFGRHYGSNLMRDLTDRYQPLLTVGAHMHEYFAVEFLGATPVLNAGFGPDKHTLVEITDGVLSRLALYAGDRLVREISASDVPSRAR